MQLKKYWENILDYIFPRECFKCKKEGEYLCSSCFDKIKFIKEFYCFLCNEKQASAGVCSVCVATSLIDKIIVATPYGKSLAGKMIESFKYNYVQTLSDLLVKILDRQIQVQNLTSVVYNQILLPIPLHKKRFNERGFNQAEELAKGLSAKYNCCVEPNLLLRVKNTEQQAKLSRKDRFANIKEAFKFNIKKAVPEKVILIDDVLTSGATFISAAKALKKAGVKEVVCLAVAHG